MTYFMEAFFWFNLSYYVKQVFIIYLARHFKYYPHIFELTIFVASSKKIVALFSKISLTFFLTYSVLFELMPTEVVGFFQRTMR